jgi:hypothetical protein
VAPDAPYLPRGGGIWPDQSWPPRLPPKRRRLGPRWLIPGAAALALVAAAAGTMFALAARGSPQPTRERTTRPAAPASSARPAAPASARPSAAATAGTGIFGPRTTDGGALRFATYDPPRGSTGLWVVADYSGVETKL